MGVTLGDDPSNAKGHLITPLLRQVCLHPRAAGGQALGFVFAASIQGYSGPILSFFGLDTGNALTGVKVLSHSETPGLGAKITEEKFLKQFRGRSAEEIALRRDDPKGQIDAISAATISSRAVTFSLRSTLEQFLKGELK